MICRRRSIAYSARSKLHNRILISLLSCTLVVYLTFPLVFVVESGNL
jgi:hypothetical protein